MSGIRRYFLAALSMAGALGIQTLILHGAKIPSMGVLYPTACLVTWYLGFWPAVLAIWMGATGALYFCYEPRFDLLAHDWEEYSRLGVFILTSTIVSRVLSRGKRAELRAIESSTKLDRSEERLRAIADEIPSFIAYLDTEGRYQFVNRAYSEWFGLGLAEIQGKRRHEFTPRETAELAVPYEARALAGETVRYENVLRLPDGKAVFLDVSYLPHKDKRTGKVLGAVAVGHDVTASTMARKRAEELAGDLREAIEARDNFLSIASHELRTPLTGMKLQTQMMKRALDKGDPAAIREARVRRLVEQCSQGLDRMTRLVEDMLDISRIQSGKLLLSREPTDLGELTRETLERYAPQLEQAGIELRPELPRGTVARADRFRMEQVFTNLITNAIRYAPKAPLRVRLSEREGRATLEFHDGGPGVPKEHQERIFSRFERLVSADEISGLGLGLYIVREILAGHEGSIRVEGGPGDGARFVIELPTEPRA